MMIMLGVAQLLKYSAETSLLESMVATSESKFEAILQRYASPNHHGPVVMSAHVTKEDVVQHRYNKLQQEIKAGKFDTFTQPQGHRKFDYDATVDEILKERSKQTEAKNNYSPLEFYVGLYMSVAMGVSSLLLTKTLHKETTKLHEMNRVFHNKNARVVKAQTKDDLLKTIDEAQVITNQKPTSKKAPKAQKATKVKKE